MVSGILPRGQSRFKPLSRKRLADLNRRARTVNSKLDEYLFGNSRATYLPHPDWSAQGRLHRQLLSDDGLHPSPSGQEMLAQEITTAVAFVKQV